MLPKGSSVYIAGKMRGLPNFNFPAFDEAERQLRHLGYNPYNPARVDRLTYGAGVSISATGNIKDIEYLGFDVRSSQTSGLTWIGNHADAICVMPNWQQSKGARLEVHVAQELGLPIMCITDEGLVPRVRAIGLSGYAQTGKDTVAEVLNQFGYKRVSFADNLRKILLTIDPIMEYGGFGDDVRRVSDEVEIHGWEYAKKIRTPDRPEGEIRVLLQRLGTEGGRALLGDNIWVDTTLNNIPDGTKVVLTDCRFPNEAEAIHAVGGKVWRVTRPNVGALNNHPSETSLDYYQFDAHIENKGTHQELRTTVIDLMLDSGLITDKLDT